MTNKVIDDSKGLFQGPYKQALRCFRKKFVTNGHSISSISKEHLVP